MANQPLKIALTGCGGIARDVHIPILRRLPGVRLVAVADPNREVLEAARRLAPACATFERQDAMLDRVEADAVVIAAPSVTHADLACEAFNRSKHVYLEKPLATDLADGRRVLAAWRACGRIGMTGFNYRFHPLVGELRRQIAAERLGEVLGVRTAFSIAARGSQAWRASRARGGGALLDLGSHHADLIPFVLGRRIVGAHAAVRSVGSEEDCAVVQFQLEDGLMVQSFFSACGPEMDSFEVVGERGSLKFDRYTSERIEYVSGVHGAARMDRLLNRVKSFVPGAGWITKLRAPLHEPSYEASMAHFIRAARGEAAPECDLTDGYESLAVIATAESSAKSGVYVSCERGRAVGL